MEGERVMTLEDNPRPGAVTRMRWENVTDDGLSWVYESRPAAERAWKPSWRIEYARRRDAAGR